MRKRAVKACGYALVGAAVITAVALRTPAEAPATQPMASQSGVAVVELFTSQGCSSCPPADAALAELGSAAAREGRPVYALAFHVDYWNRLGWADPFSDAAFSRRQEDYARAFKLDQLYTPQMIVNGRTQFVGSDREAARRAVGDALAAPAVAHVTVSVTATRPDGYRVRPVVSGAPKDAVINVAVVERDLSTDVKAGENKGRRLEQPSTVRWFTTVPAADAQEIVIPALPSVRPEHASVIIFAQRPQNGPILGAAQARLR